jgi:hypothetical protein
VQLDEGVCRKVAACFMIANQMHAGVSVVQCGQRKTPSVPPEIFMLAYAGFTFVILLPTYSILSRVSASLGLLQDMA